MPQDVIFQGGAIWAKPYTLLQNFPVDSFFTSKLAPYIPFSFHMIFCRGIGPCMLITMVTTFMWS